MICPHCIDRDLKPVFRDGIEIDICPRCRGIWLDSGELAKLTTPQPVSTLAAPIPADQYDPAVIAEEGQAPPSPDRPDRRARVQDDRDDDVDRDDDDRSRSKKSKGKGKRKGKDGKRSKKRKSQTVGRRLGRILADVIDELD